MIAHRGGWKVLGILGTYVHSTDGGDEYTSRLLAFLDPNTKEFSALPPHFMADEQLFKEEEWAAIFPSYKLMSPQTRAALPYLVASLINAKKQIFEHTAEKNPIRHNVLWKHYDRLAPKVHLGYMKNEVTGV
jgi:hypothetical protein